MNNVLFETGQATTDGAGEVTIFLTCFKPSETPSITATARGTSTIVNVRDLTFAGSTWTAKLITASPNTSVDYHAFISNTTIDAFTNIITQDLQDILAQDNSQIFVQ